MCGPWSVITDANHMHKFECAALQMRTQKTLLHLLENKMGLFGCRLTVLGIDRQRIAQSSFMDFTPAVG